VIKQSAIKQDWELMLLGDVCKTTSGGTPRRSVKAYFQGDIPWVKSGELPDGLVHNVGEYISEEAVSNSSAKVFPAGTLLIALYGATVGKLGILTFDAASNQAVCAIFPKKNIELKYLYWHLRNVRSDLIKQAIGGAQPNISQGILRNIPVPVAPIDQQKRIVEEIEKQFSRLDEAEANLKRVKANLKRYKTSVLRAAVTGKLTEDWRKKYADGVATAEEILAKIKANRVVHYEHRFTKWQQDIEQWEAGNKPGKKPRKPQKLKRLPALTPDEITNLPILPEGWAWLRLGNSNIEVSDGPFGSNLKSSDYVESGVRVIRLENIGMLEFKNDKQTFISDEKYGTIARHTVRAGDVIFSSFVADQTRVAVLPSYIDKAINKADCFCVRGNSDSIISMFIAAYLSTHFVFNMLKSEVHGATRPRINTTQLKNCPLPICSEKEQRVIIQEVESRLTVAEKIEMTVDANLKRAERLRQSILKQAFSGKLV